MCSEQETKLAIVYSSVTGNMTMKKKTYWNSSVYADKNRHKCKKVSDYQAVRNQGAIGRLPPQKFQKYENTGKFFSC